MRTDHGMRRRARAINGGPDTDIVEESGPAALSARNGRNTEWEDGRVSMPETPLP